MPNEKANLVNDTPDERYQKIDRLTRYQVIISR